nr:odorant receptor 13a-like isoform X1 [Nomia melanderi]
MTSETVITSAVKYFLLAIGAHPTSSNRALICALWTAGFGSMLFGQIWYVVSFYKLQPLPELLDCLFVILVNASISVKVIVIWLNYGMLTKILKIILDDWNNLSQTDPYKHLMEEKVVVSTRVSNYVMAVYSVADVIYAVVAVYMTGDEAEYDGYQRKMMLRMKFPFDAMVSPVYEVVLLAQLALEFFMVMGAGISMAFLASLVLHVGGQIDVLCQEILSVPNYIKEKRLPILKSLIVKHQKIIFLSESIKHLFLYISLAQFLTSIILICFLGFMIVTSIRTDRGLSLMAKYFPSYVTAISEAFVICYTGEYLSSKSEDIHRAMTDMDWYKLDQSDIHLIHLILLRTEKLLTLTAGKFVTLSVETFANIIKASASYVSLLLAVY